MFDWITGFVRQGGYLGVLLLANLTSRGAERCC